jgi:hypothetical protein
MKAASLGILFFIAPCSDAADLGGKVLRSVKQGSASGAQVTLTREYKAKKAIIARTTTNEVGFYIFRNIQPGLYTVTASGNLAAESPCFKTAPLNRGKAEIKNFIISRTLDLPTSGQLDLNIGIGCED